MISVGSLTWDKGYEYSLMALRVLKDRGIFVRYHMIGDGPERQRILFTVNDLDLTDRVVLYGRLPPDKIGERLRESDIFVLPSLTAGISNGVLEAMASGLAVITTDSGGNREAVTDRKHGLVVPLRDPQALADAMQTLVQDRDLRLQLAHAARQRIEEHFTLEKQIEGFVSIYRALKRDPDAYRKADR
jgi:colanic acid/amylovoran biosynthesis glycosyltransferase